MSLGYQVKNIYSVEILCILVPPLPFGHSSGTTAPHVPPNQGEDNQQDNTTNNRQGLCIHLYLLSLAFVTSRNKHGHMLLVLAVFSAKFFDHLTLFLACK